MKIITYNVNGIRAAIGKGLLEWLETTQADVLCVQETKAQPDQIPILDFQQLGYHSYCFSAQKRGYSGVAIFTKKVPDNVKMGMDIPLYDNEGRFLRADYGDISVVSVYHPSGTTGDERQSFKMKWLDDFLDYVIDLQKVRPNLILCGDFNICHRAIDIHDPVRNAHSSGFLPEEREWMEKFFNSGFIDTFRYFHQEPHNYTWWSYRANAREKNLGWRIDYIAVSKSLENRLLSASILPTAYHSDHCPAVLECRG
ncbi:MAG: exodeoxyribonuclease III [Bacteroidales bacterium]|nr:exodeoxyribonuclease III [Bacteroidales bacterium]